MEKTLSEHLKEAREKRWAIASEDQKKAHSAKMNSARWAGHVRKYPKKKSTSAPRDTKSTEG